MKRRCFIYFMVGIVFGMFDFYYHGWFLSKFLKLQQFSSLGGEMLWLILSIGIWLVPIVPVVLYETRVSKSRVRSALASSFTWCTSIIFYYLTNVVQLAFLGIPTRPGLHISNHKDQFFWGNWKNIFWYDIVGGMIEWIGIALVGGFIIGFLISIIYLQFITTQNEDLIIKNTKQT